MRLLRIAVSCLLFLSFQANADSFANLTEARKLADSAVALFKDEKMVEGYNALKPFWPLAPVEIDSLANQTATQWPLVKQRFGTSLSTEFIVETKAGQSLAQLVYLHKFERHALRWVFAFYKSADKWLINSVSFDDSIGQLLQMK